MGIIVSRKSLVVAILHFVTAAITLGIAVYVMIATFCGDLLQFDNATGELSEGIGNAFLAVFALIFILLSLSGMFVSVPMFIFSGVKLLSQAQGQLPSKRSFIFTLVVKTIAFALIAFALVFLFDLQNGLPVAILHIVALAFSLVSSLLEAYVRRKP